MIKVVFDTNVLISSTLWDGSVAQKLLFKLIKESALIFSTIEIILEYQNILRRDFDYSDKEITNIMEKVLQFVILVISEKRVKVVKEDPDDDKIIECAIASSSNYIISYDKHLLKIGKYKGINILKPEEAIYIL